MLVIEARLDDIIPAHAAKSDEIAVLIEGRIRLTQNWEVSVFEAGQCVVVPAGTEHLVEALIPSRLILIGEP